MHPTRHSIDEPSQPPAGRFASTPTIRSARASVVTAASTRRRQMRGVEFDARRAPVSAARSARERSRSSRRRMSARIAASSASCPAALSSSARRRARSSAAATTKIFTSASRADDGADVASVEHRARRRGREVALECQQRGAHLGDRRDDRGRLADGVTFQDLLVELSPDRARAPPRPRDPCRRAAARHRAAPSRPRDRSARCRDGAAGNAPRAACRACPCRTPPVRRWR